MRKAWDVPTDAPLVGMAASFSSRKKGQPDLVRAAADVLKAHGDAWFVLAGDGSPDRIRQLAEALGIGAVTSSLSGLHQRHARRARGNGRGRMCFAARRGAPTGSVREALAMARPVVSTDVAGTPNWCAMVRPDRSRHLATPPLSRRPYLACSMIAPPPNALAPPDGRWWFGCAATRRARPRSSSSIANCSTNARRGGPRPVRAPAAG